jgi:hypothetical protein
MANQFNRRDFVKPAGTAALGLTAPCRLRGWRKTSQRCSHAGTRSHPKCSTGHRDCNAFPKLSASWYREASRRNAVV